MGKSENMQSLDPFIMSFANQIYVIGENLYKIYLNNGVRENKMEPLFYKELSRNYQQIVQPSWWKVSSG